MIWGWLRAPESATLAHRLRPYVPLILIFAVALAARAGVVAQSSAGFRGSTGYDSSVYYAASSSLLHGRIPYLDFVLLHPPVIMLVLLPAALLGHWTSDQTGYLVANIEFSVIGAMNAVLVALVARRLGVGTRGAMAGGLLYAVWFAPVAAEHSARLEPLGNLFVLAGVLALITALDETKPRRRNRLLVAAGALFATAASVKIWFLVPLIVAVIWVLLVRRRRHDAVLVTIGALAAGVLIDVPFLIASRGEMWTMVVSAQLGRDSSGDPFVVRLADLTSAYWPRPDRVTTAIVVSAVVGVAVLITVLWLAWRVPAARLVVALAAAMLLTLLLSPSWFLNYADFGAAPVAICAGAATRALPDRVRIAGWAPAVCAAGVTLAVLLQGEYRATVPWGPHAMVDAARSAGCVTSDSPAGLIALDALDRDLHIGCNVWVDPVGLAYLDSHAAGQTLATNRAWQRQVVAHLLTGRVAYPYLWHHTLDPKSRRVLARDGVVRRIHTLGRRFVLYLVQPGEHSVPCTISRELTGPAAGGRCGG